MYVQLYEDFSPTPDLRPEGYNRKATTGMNWIRQEKRLAIYMRDGLRCAYCGKDVYEIKETGGTLTLDHVRPHIHSIKAGERPDNSDANLVSCCSTCNSVRQDMDLQKFVGKMSAKLQTEPQKILDRIQTSVTKPLNMRLAKEMIIQKGSALAVIMSKHPDLTLEQSLIQLQDISFLLS